MSLNIKNERVHEMVREASALTGKSQTGVIEEALRKYLDDLAVNRTRLEAQRSERLAELLDYFAHARACGVRFPDHESLYDLATGLPA